jgi:hypothetical protein
VRIVGIGLNQYINTKLGMFAVLLVLKYCDIGNSIWQYFFSIAAGIAIYLWCSIENGIAIVLTACIGNTLCQYFFF